VSATHLQKRVAWLRALVVMSTLCASSRAFGFCRTTTCDPKSVDPSTACRFANGCPATGKPLFWSGLCTSFSIQQDGSPLRNITTEQAHEAIARAFAVWRMADCGNGQHPSIEVTPKADVSCATQEYNQHAGNANIWMFRDDTWPYEGTADTLALTTLTFNIDTGEIYDADVEINSHEQEITFGDEHVVADLESIVTHEAGHFLGLAHSLDKTATMYPSYIPGATALRNIHPDDVLGICSIYPPKRSYTGTSCEPRHCFSTLCGAQQLSCPAPASTDSGGCSVGASAPSNRLSLAACFVALASSISALRWRSRHRRFRGT
jgi:predicted Zn-dependent protease